MKHKILEQALDEISDRHIEEAVKPKKRSPLRWVGAVAAVLAAALLISSIKLPIVIEANAICTPSANRTPETLDTAYHDKRSKAVRKTLTDASGFFTDSSQIFLHSETGENKVWSPVNGYIALAMLAETTNGNTRTQILETLGADSMEALRSQVSAIWEASSTDDGKELSVLANSLWLDDSLTYRQEAIDHLSYDHYASVYQGDLSSQKTNKALQAWLSQQTGGHLKKSAETVKIPEDTVMVLASTVHMQSKWSDEFSSFKNTHAPFHAPDGDVSCTYMNKKEHQTYYYWGDSYGAVSLSLKNGCSMWFLLPDPDKTPQDILKDSQYLTTITKNSFDESPNSKYMKVNLSVPKFDVHSSCDMKEGLQQLGITDAFQPQQADFSSALDVDFPVFLQSVQQAARVTIDEKGVTASSYIEIPGAGASAPPEEVVDFVLDRPFVFAITRNGIPLFTGIVNNPA